MRISIDVRVCKFPGRKSQYLCIYDMHKHRYRALARFLGDAQADEFFNTMKVIEEQGCRANTTGSGR